MSTMPLLLIPEWVEPVADYMIHVGLPATLKVSAVALVCSSIGSEVQPGSTGRSAPRSMCSSTMKVGAMMMPSPASPAVT